ncbi:hypothetical protein D3C81_1252350 [compost metagenome]
MVVAAIDHIAVGGGDTGGVGTATTAGAFALTCRAHVISQLKVPVTLLLDVLHAHVGDIFQANHVAQAFEESITEIR